MLKKEGYFCLMWAIVVIAQVQTRNSVYGIIESRVAICWRHNIYNVHYLFYILTTKCTRWQTSNKT